MNATKADAIQYLKSSIARYRHELDSLPYRGPDRAAFSEQRRQLHSLIDDAKRLLVELRPR